jgi:hypothetical protein
MGTPAIAQRLLLGKGRNHRQSSFTNTHHPYLGSRRGLPYSADRGKKSVNRQALDELKGQIPLMGYLQAHDWQPARPLSRGRWMGLCPLHGITSQASWWIPIKTSSTARAVAAAGT